MSTILYLVLAFVGFIILMQLIAKISSLLKKGKPAPQVSGALGQKISSGQKVLLYFFSPTCGACKAMTPVIDKMRNENANVYKINVTQKPDISRAFGILGTPATILLENKKISKFVMGAKSESFLRSII
jgi:thioredoxin 1